MKAFEKWNKGIERKNGEWCSWQEREDAWKAALEWALIGEGKMYYDNYDYYKNEGCLVVPSEQIREELKDENNNRKTKG